MIRAYRLSKTRHLAAAFTGEGARLNGGRWNSRGTAMVYTSSSLSLATLEVLVHLEDPVVFGKLFSWVSLEIPSETLETMEPETLSAGWNDDESSQVSRAIGDAWLRALRSAALAVPSVVTPGELNYLLNPAHPDFPKILIGTPQPFRPDSRLLR